MFAVLRHTFTPRIAATVALETASLVAGLCVLPFVFATELVQSPETTSTLLYAGFVLFTLSITQFSLWSFGLYTRDVVYCGTRLFHRLGLAALFSCALLGPPYALFWLTDKGLAAFPLGLLSGSVALFWGFALFTRPLVLSLLPAKRKEVGNVLVIGNGPATDALAKEVDQNLRGVIELVGVLTTQPDEIGETLHGFPICGSVRKIREFVESKRVGTIVVALPRHDPDMPADFLIRCKLAGVRVFHVSDFYESMSKKVLLESFSPLDFLYRRNLVMTQFRWRAKSTADKTIALCILLPALPIMALAALLVRLGSPGPILYRQVRSGLGGKPFEVLKFRSMVADAERNGAMWAQKNDPRVTRWGRFMRLTRIDELPQLFNILRGEMSFVGPRPERPEFVAKLREEIPHYNERHLVKPGLTGWAQVAFRYGSSIEDTAEKLRYDIYYIKNMGLCFDLLIVLSTIRTVVYDGGAH